MNSSTTSPKRKPLEPRRLLFSRRRSPAPRPPKPQPQTEGEKRDFRRDLRKRRGKGWKKYTVTPHREETLAFSRAKLDEIHMKEKIREDLENIRITLRILERTKHSEKDYQWMSQLEEVLDTLFEHDRITQELLEDITIEKLQLGFALEEIMECAHSYFAQANEMYYDYWDDCWRPDYWDFLSDDDYVDDYENEYLLLHNEHRGDGDSSTQHASAGRGVLGGVAAGGGGGDGRSMFAEALSPTTPRSPPTRSPRPRPHTRLFDGLRF